MRTREGILDKYAVGVAAGQYTIDCDKAHKAMDEYAREVAIEFKKFCEEYEMGECFRHQREVGNEHMFDLFMEETKQV